MNKLRTWFWNAGCFIRARRGFDLPTTLGGKVDPWEDEMNDKRGGRIYKSAGAFLGGVLTGMVVMYVADPDGGARRRALARDKAAHALHRSKDFLGKAGRDLRNRIQGLAAGARHVFPHEEVDTHVLTDRVRAELGHRVSHPRAIDVSADQGRVTLRGLVIAGELGPLLAAVSRVPGVRAVENRLDVHDVPDVPALQGGATPEEPVGWWSSRKACSPLPARPSPTAA